MLQEVVCYILPSYLIHLCAVVCVFRKERSSYNTYKSTRNMFFVSKRLPWTLAVNKGGVVAALLLFHFHSCSMCVGLAYVQAVKALCVSIYTFLRVLGMWSLSVIRKSGFALTAHWLFIRPIFSSFHNNISSSFSGRHQAISIVFSVHSLEKENCIEAENAWFMANPILFGDETRRKLISRALWWWYSFLSFQRSDEIASK